MQETYIDVESPISVKVIEKRSGVVWLEIHAGPAGLRVRLFPWDMTETTAAQLADEMMVALRDATRTAL